MARSRLNRVFVVLALLLAQAALGLPLAGTVGVARAQTAEAMIAHTGGVQMG